MLTAAERQELKKQAQHLSPVVWIGKEGISERLLKSVEAALLHHQLIKVKFIAFKEEKKKLTPVLADKTGSELVTRVGNVVVLYKKSSQAEEPQQVPQAES